MCVYLRRRGDWQREREEIWKEIRIVTGGDVVRVHDFLEWRPYEAQHIVQWICSNKVKKKNCSTKVKGEKSPSGRECLALWDPPGWQRRRNSAAGCQGWACKMASPTEQGLWSQRWPCLKNYQPRQLGNCEGQNQTWWENFVLAGQQGWVLIFLCDKCPDWCLIWTVHIIELLIFIYSSLSIKLYCKLSVHRLLQNILNILKADLIPTMLLYLPFLPTSPSGANPGL